MIFHDLPNFLIVVRIWLNLFWIRILVSVMLNLSSLWKILKKSREPYCPIVEDISFDDDQLLSAVNHIENVFYINSSP